jgi:hypothetical protein
MAEDLYRALLEHETELVDGVIHELKHSTARVYVEMEWETLHRRIEALVAHLLVSIRESPVAFINYVAEIADTRLAEGCPLEEILLALRVLEEKVWIMTTGVMPLENQIEALCRITGTVGAAKDRLAAIYVRSARTSHHAAAASNTDGE